MKVQEIICTKLYLTYGGGVHKTCSIYLDKCVFQVTKSLHAALLSIRNRHFERVIWIDAICINQNDLKEREHQIQYMAKIYSMAKSVIIWLGDSTEASNIALRTIRNSAQTRLEKPLLTRTLCNDVLREVSFAAKNCIPSLRETEHQRNDLLKALGIAAKKSMVKPPPSTEFRKSILNLLQKPWFRRIWVSV